MVTRTFAIFLNAAVQYKINIFQRLVVDEPVRLGAVKAVVCYFILHGNSIDRNQTAVCE